MQPDTTVLWPHFCFSLCAGCALLCCRITGFHNNSNSITSKFDLLRWSELILKGKLKDRLKKKCRRICLICVNHSSLCKPQLYTVCLSSLSDGKGLEAVHYLQFSAPCNLLCPSHGDQSCFCQPRNTVSKIPWAFKDFSPSFTVTLALNPFPLFQISRTSLGSLACFPSSSLHISPQVVVSDYCSCNKNPVARFPPTAVVPCHSLFLPISSLSNPKERTTFLHPAVFSTQRSVSGVEKLRYTAPSLFF